MVFSREPVGKTSPATNAAADTNREMFYKRRDITRSFGVIYSNRNVSPGQVASPLQMRGR